MECFEITETELWAYISKSADAITVLKVEKWMASSSFDKDLFIKTKAVYHHTLTTQPSIETAKKNFFEAVDLQEKQTVFLWKNILKYAAVFLVLITGIYTTKQILSDKNQVIAQTVFGEQKKINLSDGSVVWLNASSKLAYNKKDSRTLYLEGEAFFEVAKDSIHPFTVSTFDAVKVRALGTSFNVKSYLNSTTTETKLITGKVEVTNNKVLKNKTILFPYEKAVFDRTLYQMVKSKIKGNNKTIAWRDGKIQFRNKFFKDIALDLKNQFNIKLSFANPQIANSKFTGSFSNTTSIDEILEVLKISKNFNYKLNTDTNEWIIE